MGHSAAKVMLYDKVYGVLERIEIERYGEAEAKRRAKKRREEGKGHRKDPDNPGDWVVDEVEIEL